VSMKDESSSIEAVARCMTYSVHLLQTVPRCAIQLSWGFHPHLGCSDLLEGLSRALGLAERSRFAGDLSGGQDGRRCRPSMSLSGSDAMGYLGSGGERV
jgi:hypothetical protein